MNNVVKNPAGEVIRFTSRRMRVTVARPQYVASNGEPAWARRFYYAKMINGVLKRFPLSADPDDAGRTADQIAAFFEDPAHTLLDAERKFNPRALARGSDYSTVGELFDYHRDHWRVLELSNNTGANYQHNLLIVLRYVVAWRKKQPVEKWSGKSKGKAELLAPWLARSLTDIDEKLAMDYQRLMVPPELEDEEEIITRKITCDSNLRGARALFSKEAMAVYRASRTLVLPDVSGFLGVSLFHAKKYFVLPDPEVIRRIFTAAPTLKAEDVNAYRAFLLCVQAGLRKTEAANFRMEWLRQEDSPAVLIHEDGKFAPKHGHGRKVFLEQWAADEIRSLAGERKFFLDGTETERASDVFVRLNGWLRQRGIDSTKPTHELRKLWFSQKVKREGIESAAKQGGHRDPKITTSFYSDSTMPDNVLAFWTEPTLSVLGRLKTA